jgi:multimeric flavodoxin WrbA
LCVDSRLRGCNLIRSFVDGEPVRPNDAPPDTTYGHTDVLAKAVIQGVESIGATVKHFQIPETLPQEVRDKLLADPIRDIPAITPDDLKNFDGFL